MSGNICEALQALSYDILYTLYLSVNLGVVEEDGLTNRWQASFGASMPIVLLYHLKNIQVEIAIRCTNTLMSYIGLVAIKPT